MKSAQLLHDDTLASLDAFCEKPAHAVLMAGREGLGKARLAAEVAAELLHAPITSLENNAQLRHIEPTDGKILLAPVRELQQFMSRTVPGEHAVSRVVTITDADAMTRDAQNALLKLLEEPPEKTVFILTSSRPRLLLPTIHSRVQKLQVMAPPPETVLASFVAKGYTSAAVQKAQLIAGGNLSLLEQILSGSTDEAQEYIDLAKKVLSSDQFTRLAYIDAQFKDKTRAQTFVDTLAAVAASSLHHTAQTSGGSGAERWRQTLAAAHTAQAALRRNGNTKLVLSELMLSL